MKGLKIVGGVIYDPVKKESFSGRIYIERGKIVQIEKNDSITGPVILPGFVDSHIHIESSMLTPKQFSRIAKSHGTIAVVADPHEIANVAGVEGINFMINNSLGAEIKIFFGAPSCVPASPFDDCCKVLNADEIEKLLSRDDIYFLGEMMNFPGVIFSDPDVMRKLKAAADKGKVVDGHAPGLKDENLKKYVSSGISTDHECFTLEEALEKIALGMKILIREGSAAKNYNSLCSLIKTHPESTMLCTDDCHPEDLLVGHINRSVKRSLNKGFDIFDILQVVSVNPIKHYGLNLGLLQPGDSADFIIVDNLKDLNVLANYISGENIIEKEVSPDLSPIKVNYDFPNQISISDIELKPTTTKLQAIGVIEGELVTNKLIYNIGDVSKTVKSDITNDYLKIVVVNRYKEKEVYVGLIKGFGLKKGAIAESIAHDSHHIIAVGVDDKSILDAINYIINQRGGVCYNNGDSIIGLPLPNYGLISDQPVEIVAHQYDHINNMVKKDGCALKAPFMTLSFMALSVIPNIKITPRGLFDINQFNFVEQFI